MRQAVICPVCNGTGKYEGKNCHGCNGKGWIEIGGNDYPHYPHVPDYPPHYPTYPIYPLSYITFYNSNSNYEMKNAR